MLINFDHKTIGVLSVFLFTRDEVVEFHIELAYCTMAVPVLEYLDTFVKSRPQEHGRGEFSQGIKW